MLFRMVVNCEFGSVDGTLLFVIFRFSLIQIQPIVSLYVIEPSAFGHFLHNNFFIYKI